MIGALASAAAVHILNNDRRISRNMFSQERHHSSNAEIAGATRRRGRDKRYRLTRVKSILRVRNIRKQTDQRPE